MCHTHIQTHKAIYLFHTHNIDNNFCYLLFACDEDFVKIGEEIIRELIIDYIESVYKVNFIKEIIKNPYDF